MVDKIEGVEKVEKTLEKAPKKKQKKAAPKRSEKKLKGKVLSVKKNTVIVQFDKIHNVRLNIPEGEYEVGKFYDFTV